MAKSKADKAFESKNTKGQCDILITNELKKMYQKQKKEDLDRHERAWILSVRNEKREEGHQDKWYEDYRVNPEKIKELRTLSLEEIKRRAAEAHTNGA